MKRRSIAPVLLSIAITSSALFTPASQSFVYAAETPVSESEEVEDTENVEATAEEPTGSENAEDQTTVSDSISDESDNSTSNSTVNSVENDGLEEDNTQQDSEDSETQESSSQDDTAVSANTEDIMDDSDTAPTQDEDSNSAKTDPDKFVFKGHLHAATEGQEATPNNKDGKSSDDLFADYVESSFKGQINQTSSGRKKASRSATSNLTGIETAIYGKIAEYLPAIAAGERASTVFEISVDDLNLEQTSWTAEELGIQSILTVDENGNILLDENGNASISVDAINAVQEKVDFDLGKVVNALLASYPYHLYWYEKTQNTTTEGFGISADYDYDANDYYIYIEGNMSVFFPVASEYSAGSYTVDTSIGKSVQTSVANANAIVSKYSSSADYEKLIGYKNDICELVSYNHDAVDGGASYGNPWQMIWVFDGDPTTNVVCEGYAKAFKYLCDQTAFSDDISCITATGTMNGGTGEGRHMWNIVNMDDGNNYLVDVTNCDDGTIGAPDQLFLAGYDSGDFESGYKFSCTLNNVSYTYDSETIGIYTTEDLLIADDDYSNGSAGPDDPEVKPDPLDASVLQYHIDNGGVIIDEYTGGEADSIVIPDTIEGLPVVEIGDGAFNSHYDITGTLYLPDSIEVIGFNAFAGTGLQKIDKMPSNLRIIEDQAFHYNLSMRGDLVLPATTEHIGRSAFDACYFDGILQLNEGLVSIGENAFTNCQFKGDLIIPSTVTEMGRAAFSGSQFDGNLIILSENLEEIPDLAFYYCDKLSGITIPDSIKCINYSAFCHCHSLNGDLVIPASVEEIGFDAFYQCSFGGRLILNEGLKVVKGEAFYSCRFEGNLALPSTVTFIGDNAFAWNNFSGSLVLPDGLEHIGKGAFQATTLSGSVVIPDSVISVGKNAFNSFYGMEVIGLKEYEPYFEFESLIHGWNRTGYELTSYNNSVVNELTLPQTYNGIPIYRIGLGAFFECDGLIGHVIIPEGYEVIDIDAFKYCNRMTSISLPSTLETICTTSFDGCTALTDVYYAGTRLQAQALAKGCMTVKDITWHCTDGDLPRLVDLCTDGHTETVDPRVEPTCTETGLTEGTHCSYCGEVLVAQEVIPALGHSLLHIDAIPASFERDGVKEHYRCERCGKLYWDENGTSEADQVDTIDPRLYAITLDPIDVTVLDGEVAEFSVNTLGVDLTYQWQYRPNDGESWTDLAGEKSETLTVNASLDMNGYQYHCKVGNGYLEADSMPAVLTVTYRNPEITEQPEDVKCSYGEKAHFHVIALGSELSYRWEYSSNEGATWRTWSGKTEAEATATASTSNDGFLYRCIVSNDVGTVISESARLTLGRVPVITKQPEDVYGVYGQTVTFSVEATSIDGEESLTYRWEYSRNNGESWRIWTGKTEAEASAKFGSSNDGFLYRCVVTNDYGSVTSEPAKLTRHEGPVITVQPENVSGDRGESAVFHIEAESPDGETLSYSWEYSSNNGSSWRKWNGKTEATATAKIGTSNDGYLYRCVVSDEMVSVTSTAAKLTMNKGPVITVHPEDVSAKAGETVTFRIEVETSEGEGLSYQWEYCKKEGGSWRTWSGKTGPEATAKAGTANNGFLYRCVVTNSSGSVASDPAKLTVTTED